MKVREVKRRKGDWNARTIIEAKRKHFKHWLSNLVTPNCDNMTDLVRISGETATFPVLAIFPSWNSDWVLWLLLNLNHLAQEYPSRCSTDYTIRDTVETKARVLISFSVQINRTKATVRNTKWLKWIYQGMSSYFELWRQERFQEILFAKKWKCTEYLSSAWHVGTQARPFSPDHPHHP